MKPPKVATNISCSPVCFLPFVFLSFSFFLCLSFSGLSLLAYLSLGGISHGSAPKLVWAVGDAPRKPCGGAQCESPEAWAVLRRDQCWRNDGGGHGSAPKLEWAVGGALHVFCGVQCVSR